MSDSTLNPAREADIDELANQLRLLKRSSTWPRVSDNPDDPNCGGAVFLIGAGCSASAGVPLASDIAQECAKSLFRQFSNSTSNSVDASMALKWLKEKNHLTDHKGATWADYYSEIFEKHFRSDPQQREIIQKNVAKASGKINWAHICLGELVVQHYVHSVLTTNFDRLILEGILLAGHVPVIADGLEALKRISSRPAMPQVVHLHGSLHAYSPLNSREAMLAAGRTLAMRGAMFGMLKDTGFLVVVGYAGGEDGVMELLFDATREFPNLVIYWVFHENDYSNTKSKVRCLLSGPNKFYILGQDADMFFATLTRALEFHPSWIARPASPLEARERAVVDIKPSPEIDLAMKGYRRAIEAFKDLDYGKDDPQANIEHAAGLILAGDDVAVLDRITPSLAEQFPPAARIRAIALQRQGDSDASSPSKADQAASRSQLREAVRLWELYLRIVCSDGEGYWRLGQTQASLAEKSKGHSNRWDGAIKAFQSALTKLNREGDAWVHCTRDFAAAAFEEGSQGNREPAIKAIDAVLDAHDFTANSVYGSRILDLRAALLLMRANAKKGETAFLEAVEGSRRAIKGVWSELGTSEAIGGHHHLAQACRDFGQWLVGKGRKGEGLNYLQEARQLFVRVEEAYQRGAPDAELKDLKEAAKAANDEVLAVTGAVKCLQKELAS